jgi:hypothetical protein
MRFPNQARHWVLQHYLWIATGLFGFSLVAILTFAKGCENQVKFTIIGVPFTFVILVQKQKLEETRLFKELFTAFNTRYDSLNEDLNRIRTDTKSVGMIHTDRDVLYNYFNLCAEEHLFRSQGYIPEVVWRSWWEGMRIFFNCPRIRKEWDADSGTNSYYGFVPPEPDSKTPIAGGIPNSEDTDQRDAA